MAIDVPPAAGRCAVPTLLLQPLVENAVKHGLAPKREGGTSRIRAVVAGGRLCIAIADSGLGFDPDSTGQSGGVGLASVSRRLCGALRRPGTPGRRQPARRRHDDSHRHAGRAWSPRTLSVSEKRAG